jgi:hypothetical protein
LGVKALAVTYTGTGFLIQTTNTPAAFSSFWNGAIRLCGGSNPYVGTYNGQTTATCSNFGAVTNPNFQYAFNLTIDSVGNIADDGSRQLFGSINGAGAGSFSGPEPGFSNLTRSYQITGVAQNAGKWVINGTISAASMPVGCGTLTLTFTTTQQ